MRGDSFSQQRPVSRHCSTNLKPSPSMPLAGSTPPMCSSTNLPGVLRMIGFQRVHLRVVGVVQIVHRPAALGGARHHALVDLLGQPPGDAIADHAGLGQDIELAVGDVRPRHDHRLDAVAVAALRVQRDLVVVLVHHRDDVQAALQAERRLHLLPVLERGVLEFEMAEDVVRLQGELLLRADEMEMAVAGAGRQLQLRLGIAAVDLRRERARCAGRVRWTIHFAP